MGAPSLGRVAIVGLGLIGGSVARALKAAGRAERIVAAGRSRANLERGLELGVVDAISTDVSEVVRDADLVLLCVPMGAYPDVLAAVAESAPASAVVTDAGSAKVYAVETARRLLPHLSRFVPGHPVAGTEHSGVEASFADLFRGRRCILTPLPETDVDALETVRSMWIGCGAEVECMEAGEHDTLLAAVSHLPHVVAYALVNAVRRLGDGEHDPFRFAAGGFRDFTRIASSSPEMWRDIALTNREALLDRMEALEAELAAVRAAVEEGDGERLREMFAAAKRARDAWIAGHGGEV